jgi:signal transduction histidine kinase
VEHELADFTELVATAIANADAQAELTASRARIVASADEARRRIVRDLHDAAQQRLVHTIVTLKLAKRAREANDDQTVGELVEEALGHAEGANTELRELVYGILPGILNRGGLAPSVAELARRLRIPVDVEVSSDRFPTPIEATAYFVIAEALTNVAKHSGAQSAQVRAEVVDHTLKLDVHDDGIGGARREGSGLGGLTDRVVALGGELEVDSPEGGGTRVTATLPLPG